MARIVLGMAVPHSGMLGKAPETWLEDGQGAGCSSRTKLRIR